MNTWWKFLKHALYTRNTCFHCANGPGDELKEGYLPVLLTSIIDPSRANILFVFNGQDRAVFMTGTGNPDPR